MSLKHILPTFRNRFNFVIQNVEKHSNSTKFKNMLNLGTGEGDFDEYLAKYTEELTSCDINVFDIEQAKRVNKDIPNIIYQVKDALETEYPNDRFDLIVCTEVIEHVGNPTLLLKEIHRILAENGIAILTFPSRSFPITYDPLNYIAKKLRSIKPIINQGAYAFGHTYLIDYEEFCKIVDAAGLQIKSSTPLSGYLIGFLEMYWTGIFQNLFKSNSKNLNESKNKFITIKSKSSKIPFLSKITDFIIKVDRAFFTIGNNSIGIGIIIVKKSYITV